MNRRHRHGLTLTELLVVGTIILAVTAISIPVVKPMMESQLTKNGANMVATALNRARNRAVANGRACGVRFEYWPGTMSVIHETQPYLDENGNYSITRYVTPGASLVLRQVEVPPVYTGLLGIEKVTYADRKGRFPNDAYILQKLARKPPCTGKIQIGGSGPFYTISKCYYSGNPSEDYFELKDGETYALPPDREDTQYSFKVLQDSRTTMALPVYLPRGAAVDLQFSGIGDTLFMEEPSCEYYNEPAEQTSLAIMFSPDGSVESVGGTMPTEPIHFLIGRWEQTSAVRADDDTESLPNYADGRNYWVTVFPQTGSVTVSQVNPTDDVGYAPPLTRQSSYNNEMVPDTRLPDGVIATSRELTR